MNIKLTDISFNLTSHTDRCCLNTFTVWSQLRAGKVVDAEGDIEETWDGEVEVGTVINCPHCGSNYLLNDKGEFEWVDPEEFDLVDADEAPTVEAGLAVMAV
jgi:hypothetical protein